MSILCRSNWIQLDRSNRTLHCFPILPVTASRQPFFLVAVAVTVALALVVRLVQARQTRAAITATTFSDMTPPMAFLYLPSSSIIELEGAAATATKVRRKQKQQLSRAGANK